jgi:DNA repair protein RecO (recombination protein O)
MIRLSRFLGFAPQGQFSPSERYFDLQEGRFCGRIPASPFYLEEELSKVLDAYLASDYSQLPLGMAGKDQRKFLLSSLVTFFRLHIPNFGELKSQEILEQVII